jgi:hypothetical protein
MDDVQEIEQRSQPQIFWTQEMSACALKYLAQLVADGIRVDKGFKSSHYNQCAKVVKERFQVLKLPIILRHGELAGQLIFL